MPCFGNTPNLSQSFGIVSTRLGKWLKTEYQTDDMTINFVIYWTPYKKFMTQIGLGGENMVRTMSLLVGLL